MTNVTRAILAIHSVDILKNLVDEVKRRRHLLTSGVVSLYGVPSLLEMSAVHDQ